MGRTYKISAGAPEIDRQIFIGILDQFRFVGNCPPTPSLIQHFAPSETQMLTLRYGSGRWAAPQKFHPGGAAEEESAA